MLYDIMTQLLFLTIGAGVAASLVAIIGLTLQSTMKDE
jgi:integral membrane sensor domain MASE1